MWDTEQILLRALLSSHISILKSKKLSLGSSYSFFLSTSLGICLAPPEGPSPRKKMEREIGVNLLFNYWSSFTEKS